MIFDQAQSRIGIAEYAFVGIVVISFLLAIWGSTAVTIQESDGAELAASAVTKSLIHPPGYPLYMAIADQLVALFPKNPYSTLSKFSAVSVSAALLLLMVFTRWATGSFIVALAATVAFGFYEPTLRTATDAEVFALYLLAATGLVFLGWYLLENDVSTVAPLGLFGVLWGLGLCHHHLLLLWTPLPLGVIVANGFHRGGWGGVFDLGLAFFIGLVVGLTPYLLLFVRYQHAPAIAFVPLDSASDFIRYVLRAGYGFFSLKSENLSGQESMLLTFVKSSLSGLSLPLIACLIVPFSALILRSTRHFILTLCVALHLVALLLMQLPATPQYSEWIQRFFPAFGLLLILVTVVSIGKRPTSIPGRLLLAAALITPALYGASDAMRRADLRGDTFVAQEVESLLNELPKNAVLVTGEDRITFGTWYYQRTRNHRPDVRVVALGLLQNEYYQRRIEELLALPAEFEWGAVPLETLAESNESQVFTSLGVTPPKGWTKIPFGVSWKLVRNSQIEHLKLAEIRRSWFKRTAPIRNTTIPKERQRSKDIKRELLGAGLGWFRKQASR